MLTAAPDRGGMSAPDPIPDPTSPRPATPDDAAVGPSRGELVRRMVDEVVNRGRHELLAQILDERHLYHDAATASLIVGCDAPVRWLAAVGRAFPDRYVIVEELVDGVDWVLVRWSFA